MKSGSFASFVSAGAMGADYGVPDDEGRPIEPCGFCRGTGRVIGPLYDREGRRRDDRPGTIACEYCNGAGECEEGSKLLPARKPIRD